MALRALLLASEKGAADTAERFEVLLNGKPVETLTLTPDNNDLLHQFVLKGVDARVPQRVDVRFEGKGGLAYQVVGATSLPWEQKPRRRGSFHRCRLRPHASCAGRYRHGHRDDPQQPATRPPTWSWSILEFRPASTCSAKTCNLSRKKQRRQGGQPGENSASPLHRRSFTSIRSPRKR